MNCSGAVERIGLLLEGVLSDRESDALKGHLEGCARCRAEFRLQETILETLSDPAGPPPSARFTDRVVEAAFAARPARHRTRWLPGAVAAAALGAVLLWAFRWGSGLRPALPAPDGTVLETLLRPHGELAASLTASFGGLTPAPDGILCLALCAGLPAAWGLHKVLSFLSE